MAELLMGKNLILFFREHSKRQTEDGAKLRFQTEHTITKEKETEAIITKDGVINTIGDGENTAEVTSLAYIDDEETITTWRQLEDMFDRNVLVEMWEIDITDPEAKEFDAKYYQGYFTSFEISAPADGQTELTYEFAINGNGVEGTDTLNEEQLAAVKKTMYEYTQIARLGESAASGEDPVAGA